MPIFKKIRYPNIFIPGFCIRFFTYCFLFFLFFIFGFSFLVIFPISPTHAQTVLPARPPIFNVATTDLAIDPQEALEVVDGDILSLSETPQVLTRSRVPYDEKMYGVVVENPMMVYRSCDAPPIVRSGEAYVNTTTINGNIETGDYITSSNLAGKGQKGTDMSGYILGVALTTLNEENGTVVNLEDNQIYYGKVLTSVGIGPASPTKIQESAGGVFGTFRQLITAILLHLQNAEEATRIIRYILAALVAIMTIFVNFATFGKNITKGIESIGRNPLAKISIQSMIVLNVILIALTTIGGIVLSLIIISL